MRWVLVDISLSVDAVSQLFIMGILLFLSLLLRLMWSLLLLWLLRPDNLVLVYCWVGAAVIMSSYIGAPVAAVMATHGCSTIWVSSLKGEVLHHSFISGSVKSFVVYEFLWRKVSIHRIHAGASSTWRELV